MVIFNESDFEEIYKTSIFSDAFKNLVKAEGKRTKFLNEEMPDDYDTGDYDDTESFEALENTVSSDFENFYGVSNKIAILKDILGKDYFADPRCWHYLSDAVTELIKGRG